MNNQLSFDALLTTEAPMKNESRTTPSEARKLFIKTFSCVATYHRRLDVFRDFIRLAANELDLARVRSEEGREEAMQICKRYEAADLEKMQHLFCFLVDALEAGMHDLLGGVFMELEFGAASMGQFFTPLELSRLMARLTIGEHINELKQRPFITLDEPASGSGGMVIAVAEHLLTQGYNPQQQLYIRCTDIDPMAADMCFVQLALLGLPATVYTGNTLSMSMTKVRHTPIYYINGWGEKLRLVDIAMRFRKVLQAV
ncbi:N-6 DNA methylase [Serratia marcescens]|uniref:N-6 DNA methylase n=1 Tax=Serratia marcescens TaxID=615 RepID=UPI003EDFF8E7